MQKEVELLQKHSQWLQEKTKFFMVKDNLKLRIFNLFQCCHCYLFSDEKFITIIKKYMSLLSTSAALSLNVSSFFFFTTENICALASEVKHMKHRKCLQSVMLLIVDYSYTFLCANGKKEFSHYECGEQRDGNGLALK